MLVVTQSTSSLLAPLHCSSEQMYTPAMPRALPAKLMMDVQRERVALLLGANGDCSTSPAGPEDDDEDAGITSSSNAAPAAHGKRHHKFSDHLGPRPVVPAGLGGVHNRSSLSLVSAASAPGGLGSGNIQHTSETHM